MGGPLLAKRNIPSWSNILFIERFGTDIDIVVSIALACLRSRIAIDIRPSGVRGRTNETVFPPPLFLDNDGSFEYTATRLSRPLTSELSNRAEPPPSNNKPSETKSNDVNNCAII